MANVSSLQLEECEFFRFVDNLKNTLKCFVYNVSTNPPVLYCFSIILDFHVLKYTLLCFGSCVGEWCSPHSMPSAHGLRI